MEKYTHEKIMNSKWPEQSAVPSPFPGHFPTRIAYTLTTKPSKQQLPRIKYAGKPSASAVGQLIRLLRNLEVPWYVSYREVDKENLLFNWALSSGISHASVETVPETRMLWSLYHPRTRPDASVMYQCLKKHSILRVKGLPPMYMLSGEDATLLLAHARENEILWRKTTA